MKRIHPVVAEISRIKKRPKNPVFPIDMQITWKLGGKSRNKNPGAHLWLLPYLILKRNFSSALWLQRSCAETKIRQKAEKTPLNLINMQMRSLICKMRKTPGRITIPDIPAKFHLKTPSRFREKWAKKNKMKKKKKMKITKKITWVKTIVLPILLKRRGGLISRQVQTMRATQKGFESELGQ